MKKTLITLLSLAGAVANGATVTISEHEGNNFITGSSMHSLMLTSVISTEDTEKIIGQGATNTALLGITCNGKNSFAVSVGSWGDDQKLVIYNAVGGEGISGNADAILTWTDGNGDAVTSSALNDYFTTTDIVAGAITLGYNTPKTKGVSESDIGTLVSFSVLYKSGEILTLYGYNNAQVYSDTHVASITYDDELLGTPKIVVSTDATNAAVTRESLVAANEAALPAIPESPSIPEPATATLSLLALAGLAARRRRK